MNGYLLLKDGSLFHGKIIGEEKNILGEILLDDQGFITVHCPSTSKYGHFTDKVDSIKGHIELANIDLQNLKLKMEKNKPSIGKLITDSLPVEYHVYDLKTFVL